MDELTAFMKARLDEDEAAAKAATPGPWAIDSEGCCVFSGDRDEVAERCQDESARHIARHDPARVLREVAAKRVIVDEHSPHWPVYFPQPSGQPMCCVCDEGGFDPSPVDWPCPTMRHLAAVWSDYPDYRQEWAPRP